MANCKASFEKHKVSAQNQNVAFQEAAGLLPEYWVCTYVHKSLKGSRSFAYESSKLCLSLPEVHSGLLELCFQWAVAQ